MKPLVCRPELNPFAGKSRREAISPMLPRPFRIADIHWETGAGDIYTWELVPADDEREPFRFKPGQFNMLFMPGQGEVPISISSDSESGKLIHSTRAVGGVTRGMRASKVGNVIGVRGPFGSSWPVAEAHGKDLVLMAGGMGLPPLRPVIYYALNHRALFNRVYLLYGARSPLEIVYRSELEKWRGEGHINVEITVDSATGQWGGHIGVVTQLLSRVTIDPANTVAMICGPEIMMHFCQLALNKAGLSDRQIIVSMERNMKCAVGHCGHCQWGPHFICKDGPVFCFDDIRELFKVHEL